MSQRRARNRHPESDREWESRWHALAELQRLSKLASEVLRADRIRSSLGPGFAAGTAGHGTDRDLQSRCQEGVRPRGLRCFTVGGENLRAARLVEGAVRGAF